MSAARVTCPVCQTVLALNVAVSNGIVIGCPSCGQQFALQVPQRRPAAGSSPPSLADDLYALTTPGSSVSQYGSAAPVRLPSSSKAASGRAKAKKRKKRFSINSVLDASGRLSLALLVAGIVFPALAYVLPLRAADKEPDLLEGMFGFVGSGMIVMGCIIVALRIAPYRRVLWYGFIEGRLAVSAGMLMALFGIGCLTFATSQGWMLGPIDPHGEERRLLLEQAAERHKRAWDIEGMARRANESIGRPPQKHIFPSDGSLGLPH